MKSVRVWNLSILVVMILLWGVSVASAQIIPSPQALSFVYQIGGPNPAAQSIYLSSNSPSQQFAVTISGAPWLSVSPTGGVTPNTLVATVTPPQGVSPGTLSGSIIIGPPASTDAQKAVVAVTLQVLAPPQGNLIVTPDAVSFDARIGGPAPPSIAVSVTSSGGAASFGLSTNAAWLYASTNSNVTPAVVQVSAYPTPGMAPGVYTGLVLLTPTYAGGASKQVYVTLRLSSGGSLVASPTYLTFNYQPGGPYPAVQTVNIVNSTGSAASFSVSGSTSNGGGWLAYSPVTANTPAAVIVSVNPAALGPGTYNGTISINPTTAGVTSTQIPVTLTVFSYSQLVVDPASLFFAYQSGGTNPAAQYLSVKSTGNPVNFNMAVQAPSWVTATTSSNTTPTGISVVATPPSSTAPGTYNGSINLTPTSGGGNPVTVPISITVTGANYLTVGRTSVAFDYSVGGTNPPPVIVPVTSSGGSLKFEAVGATQGFGPWLTVSQSSQYTPANITIGVSPQGLSAGTYTGSVVVNAEGASNGQQSIAVTLTVTNATSFSASPFGLVFSYQIGADPPKPQPFVVSAQGGSPSFNVTASTTGGGNWLMAVGSGPTPATVAAGVNPASLGPGTYTGQLQIKSSDTSIPVLQVPVVLNVAAGPVFLPAANEVSFQYRTNTAAPAAQTVTINTNTADAWVYYPTVVTADGGGWLTVTPDVGVTPSQLTISVSPAGMKAGFYYGLIAINDPGGDIPVSFVPVSLQVADTQILTVAAQTLLFNTQTGIGSLPAQQIPVKGNGGTTQFHVTTYGGNWLKATPVDGFTDNAITVTAVADALPAGYYLGVVSIEIPNVPNSQQLVPVVLVVAPGF